MNIEANNRTIYEVADETLNEQEVVEISTDTDGHIIYNTTTAAFAVLQERLGAIIDQFDGDVLNLPIPNPN